MATWASAAKAHPTPAVRQRSRPRPKPVPRQRRRQRVNGVVWIAVVAALLAGVVAMNVAVLRLNMRLDHLNRERTDLRATNARLSSRLSSAAAAPRIEALAAKELGLVQAPPELTTYLSVTP